MDKSRFSFQLRPSKEGRPTYLVWRFPLRHPAVREQLSVALAEYRAIFGKDADPNQITLGDFLPHPEHPGRIGFYPRNQNPLVLEALRIEAVQRRIAEDLALLNSPEGE